MCAHVTTNTVLLNISDIYLSWLLNDFVSVILGVLVRLRKRLESGQTKDWEVWKPGDNVHLINRLRDVQQKWVRTL